MNINEAKVIITGGGSGIGKETAMLLKNTGARVVNTGRNEPKLAASADAIVCDYIVSDASVESDVIAMFAQATKMMGGFNVLVNNAA